MITIDEHCYDDPKQKTIRPYLLPMLLTELIGYSTSIVYIKNKLIKIV